MDDKLNYEEGRFVVYCSTSLTHLASDKKLD